MRFVSLLALLLVARAEEPEPADEPAGDTDEAEATEATEADTLPLADAVLDTVTKLLSVGHYHEALEISIPAITDYPERAPSFEAVALIAVDQLQRERDRKNGVLPPTAYAAQPYSGGSYAPPPPQQQQQAPQQGYNDWSYPRYSGNPPPRRPPKEEDTRGPVLFGFELGMPTGLRVEWKAKGQAVDGVGFRAGAGILVYGGAYISPNFSLYADFQSRTDWQFELSTGLIFYYSTPYLQIGVGAQYDPPEPLQATVGLHIGTYFMIQPDLNVGFMW